MSQVSEQSFFFQAEDGIRDLTVTGVQTCALPIFLNIHPSLLPAFKGLHVQQQAIDAGARVSGCTVHIVTTDLDDGPTVAQAAVPVLVKIGRASCRDRLWIAGVGAVLENSERMSR